MRACVRVCMHACARVSERARERVSTRVPLYDPAANLVLNHCTSRSLAVVGHFGLLLRERRRLLLSMLRQHGLA